MKIATPSGAYTRAVSYIVDMDEKTLQKYVHGIWVCEVPFTDLSTVTWEWLNKNLPPTFLDWLPEQ